MAQENQMETRVFAGPVPAPCNGVDIAILLQAMIAVGAQSDCGSFRFRVSNYWCRGAQGWGRFEMFWGGDDEPGHSGELLYDFEDPKVLIRQDCSPTPVDFLLLCLAGCMTSGVVSVAAARGVVLTEVTSTVEGSVDLRRILGLSAGVRTGVEEISVSFVLRGDATPEEMREAVEEYRGRWAAFDGLTRAAADLEIRVKVE
jgi:uncharacterized OsmC-like protein